MKFMDPHSDMKGIDQAALEAGLRTGTGAPEGEEVHIRRMGMSRFLTAWGGPSSRGTGANPNVARASLYEALVW